MKLTRLTLALVICGLLVSSCANTVRGFGRDVKETGRAVEDTLQ